MAELVRLRDRKADLDAAGVQVVVVSTESAEASRKGAERFTLPFKVVSDEDGVLLDALGLRHEDGGRNSDVFYASSYLISSDGIVRFALAPDNLRRRASPDEVIEAARDAARAAR